MSNLIKITDKSPLIHTTKKINGEKVTIKTYLSAEEYFEAIRTIAETCFDDNDEYKPEYLELAWRYVVLKYFTDIEFGDMSVEEVFKVTQSDWYAEIVEVCDKYSYWFDVKNAAKELIDYRISTRKTAFDNLCDNVSAILEQDNAQNLDDIKEVLDKLDKVDKKSFVKAVVENNIEKN